MSATLVNEGVFVFVGEYGGGVGPAAGTGLENLPAQWRSAGAVTGPFSDPETTSRKVIFADVFAARYHSGTTLHVDDPFIYEQYESNLIAFVSDDGGLTWSELGSLIVYTTGLYDYGTGFFLPDGFDNARYHGNIPSFQVGSKVYLLVSLSLYTFDLYCFDITDFSFSLVTSSFINYAPPLEFSFLGPPIIVNLGINEDGLCVLIYVPGGMNNSVQNMASTVILLDVSGATPTVIDVQEVNDPDFNDTGNPSFLAPFYPPNGAGGVVASNQNICIAQWQLGSYDFDIQNTDDGTTGGRWRLWTWERGTTSATPTMQFLTRVTDVPASDDNIGGIAQNTNAPFIGEGINAKYRQEIIQIKANTVELTIKVLSMDRTPNFRIRGLPGPVSKINGIINQFNNGSWGPIQKMITKDGEFWNSVAMTSLVRFSTVILCTDRYCDTLRGDFEDEPPVGFDGEGCGQDFVDGLMEVVGFTHIFLFQTPIVFFQVDINAEVPVGGNAFCYGYSFAHSKNQQTCRSSHLS